MPRVILVEAEEDVSAGVVDLLEDLGCSVVAFDSPTPALHFLQTTPPPDLLIVDLPLGSNRFQRQLINEVRKTGSESIALAMSAASTRGISPIDWRVHAVLQKPFTAEQLEAVLGEVMEGQGSTQRCA